MIKINELRIGNHVNILSNFNGQFINFINNFQVNEESFTKYKYFGGINLTVDIIIALGFTTNSVNKSLAMVNYWNKEFDASIYVDTINGLYYYNVSERWQKQIIYVHDLQNIHFVLKNKELTFK